MIFAPALIHYKPTNGTNHTKHFQPLHIETVGNSSTQTAEQIKSSIDIYMEILAGVSLLLFLLFCVYFPSKPDHPPAPSSAIARTKFLKGIKEMLSNTDVLLACFAYSVPNVRRGTWTIYHHASGGNQCLHGCNGEPDSTTWLHRRADWKDWTRVNSRLLRGQHLLGPHHRPTEAQDESDNHHSTTRLHGQLHLVDANVLAWKSGGK